MWRTGIGEERSGERFKQYNRTASAIGMDWKISFNYLQNHKKDIEPVLVAHQQYRFQRMLQSITCCMQSIQEKRVLV